MLTTIYFMSHGCSSLPGVKLKSGVLKLLFVSFHWQTVADSSLNFSLNSITPPLSPQVVQMVWREQTSRRGWRDCREYTVAGHRKAHHIWLRLSGECCLNYHYNAPKLPANRSCTAHSLEGHVLPDWWWWQWKGCCCCWVKNVCVCVYDGVMVRMLVSFCNGTDRWSGFDRELVLISPPLSGVKWDKVDETKSTHWQQSCWKERALSFLFDFFFFLTLRHLQSRTKSADSGLCLLCVNNWLLERVLEEVREEQIQ